ncbi:cytotoxic T-lymphocyte protein 4 [Mugil cephalus]|uniref:cytotoxic T-lymphocyte protein 4 n=1 Tax=Mugil cephalus TaxID=48193 RepID=UPI001FB67D2D|nr:cytotoxic T-lymphocyte protein 4 [Mugil cephalus]
MLLTQCVMGWTVMTVLSLCLPVWSAVAVTQPYRVVSTNGTARIQCFLQLQASHHQVQPSHERFSYPEELRVTLLKGLYGSQDVCSSILNLTEQKVEHKEQKGEVQCSAQVRDGAVEVTMCGLKSIDTDLYRCKIQVFYPPPYLWLTGNGTLLHVLDTPECPVEGAQKQISLQGEEEQEAEDDEDGEKVEQVSVTVVILVILIVCVLVAVIYFQTFPCEQGRTELVRTMPVMLQKVDAVSFTCENIP